MADLWVKIPASFVGDLPIDRPYTQLEAMFSLTLDQLLSRTNSIRGYARMWMWPKTNVARFLEKITAAPPDDSTIKSDQKSGTNAGQNRDKSGTPKECKNNMLGDVRGQTRDKGGTESDHNYIERKKEELSSKEDSPSSPSKLLFDSWNQIVTGTPLPVAKTFNKTREGKCRSRLKERPLEDWQAIFRQITKTPFLCGQNNRGWKAEFDWIIKNDDNAVRVLEGKYSNSTGRRPTSENPYSMFAGT